MKYVRTTCPRPLFIGQNTGNRVFPGPEPRTYVPENVIRISPAPVTYVAEEFRRLKMCLVQCVCFLPIHSGHQVRWTYQRAWAGGKPRDSRPSRTRTAICCEIRGTSSGGGRGSSAIYSTPSLSHSNHPPSRRYSSGGRHRRRPGQGRESRSQYHSRQSQRTRRRRRQSGRWQTGKRRALTHSQ